MKRKKLEFKNGSNVEVLESSNQIRGKQSNIKPQIYDYKLLNDPISFAEKITGITLYNYQKILLKLFYKNRKKK